MGSINMGSASVLQKQLSAMGKNASAVNSGAAAGSPIQLPVEPQPPPQYATNPIRPPTTPTVPRVYTPKPLFRYASKDVGPRVRPWGATQQATSGKIR